MLLLLGAFSLGAAILVGAGIYYINLMIKNGTGRRLKQIVTPCDEKLGVFAPKCYQIVLEREL